MSEFTRYYEATIHAECHVKINELERQIAAERAKVAQLQAALHIYAVADPINPDIAIDALMVQSSDALADIRREVARECAEWCDQKGMDLAADAIRAKFGVTK